MFMLNVENKLLKKIVNLSFVIDEAVGEFDSRIWIISPIAACFHCYGSNFMKIKFISNICLHYLQDEWEQPQLSPTNLL